MPDDDMAAAERAFFASALSAFIKSRASFEVVYSLRGGTSSSITPSAAPHALVPPQRPPSRVDTLVVLDSSFNPPTLAHMEMATSALQQLRTAPGAPRQQQPTLRLLLLLAVNNADKTPKPAAFEQRLALMLALARDMHDQLRARDATAPPAPPHTDADNDSDLPSIDIGLTALPYFHEKSNAIAAAPFYAWPAETTAAPAGGGGGAATAATPEQVFLIGYDTLVRVFDPKYYRAPEPGAAAAAAPAPPLPAGLPADASPMQVALTPLMRRARLRVTVRPDDAWGDERAQQAWLQQLSSSSPAGARGGKRGLGGRGGDDWAAKIDLVPAVSQGAEAVSSTRARAAAAAQDWGRVEALVGPHVAAWVKSQKLYAEG